MGCPKPDERKGLDRTDAENPPREKINYKVCIPFHLVIPANTNDVFSKN